MLLQKFGLNFEVKESNFEENLNLKLPPKKLVQFLALGKAKVVAITEQNAVIIGADTVVVLDNKVLGKPKNFKDATDMLQSLSGRTHLVYTGLAVLDAQTKKKYLTTVTTKVVFRKLNKQEIAVYVKSGEAMGKAGSYAIQENAAVFIEKIFGDYNNIVGLPIAKLAEILKKLKVIL